MENDVKSEDLVRTVQDINDDSQNTNTVPNCENVTKLEETSVDNSASGDADSKSDSYTDSKTSDTVLSSEPNAEHEENMDESTNTQEGLTDKSQPKELDGMAEVKNSEGENINTKMEIKNNSYALNTDGDHTNVGVMENENSNITNNDTNKDGGQKCAEGSDSNVDIMKVDKKNTLNSDDIATKQNEQRIPVGENHAVVIDVKEIEKNSDTFNNVDETTKLNKADDSIEMIEVRNKSHALNSLSVYRTSARDGESDGDSGTADSEGDSDDNDSSSTSDSSSSDSDDSSDSGNDAR